jgi:hypothetical protein
MSKRKYSYFILNASFGEVDETIENYSDAFRRYQTVETPKTLYGVDEQGSISVVFSKG